MPNLAQLSAQPNLSGASPLFNNPVGDASAAGLDSGTYDAQRSAETTRHLFNVQTDTDFGTSRLQRLFGYVGAAGIDAADMVSSGIVPGVDRGDLWNVARENGLNGLANFAVKNRSGVELTSGLVTAVATAGVAEAYLIPKAADMLASSTFLQGTKLWQAGGKILGGARQVALDSAMSSAVNGELATVLGTSGGRYLLRARVAEGVGKAAVSEAAVAAVTHTNQEMWSDDASTNLAMLGLGVGLGGALGALGARFEMRQIANSDELVGARAAASDPYGYTAIREYQPDAAELKVLGPKAEYKESANTTALMLTARAKPEANATPARAALVEAEAKQAEIQAQQSLQKITSRGIEGAPNTRFNIDSEATAKAGRHLTEAMHEDPTVLFGVDSLGVGDFGRNVDNRSKYIETLMESNKVEDIRLGRKLQNQEALGLVNKTWMPDSKELRDLSNYQPGQVKLTPTSKTQGHYEFSLDLKAGKIKVNEGGGVKNFGKLDLDDQMRVYEGLNVVTNKMIQNSQEYVLPKNASWLQMDFARNFKAKGGAVDLSASGIKDFDELESLSFVAKANEALAVAKAKGGLGFWDRAKLNLPLPSSLERIHDGASDGFNKLIVSAVKNSKVTASELKESRRQLMESLDLRAGIKSNDPAIDGGMFNWNRSEKTGEWNPIVTGYASYDRVRPELIGSREHLIVSTAENKAYRAQKLNDGILSAKITQSLLPSQEYMKSVEIRGLARDQVTGATNAFDQGLGTMVTRAMRYRDSAPMMAALKMREAVDQATERYTIEFMQQNFGGVQNQLATIPNRGSKALVDQWFSFAGGWDLKKGVVPHGDSFAFELADTPRNVQRLGRPVQQGDLLTSPTTGNPVVLDNVGLDYVERFQVSARKLLRDSNAVRASRGLMPLDKKEWYVPPPDTKGKIIGFTVDANGKTVPGGAIVAASQEEFDSLRAAKLNQLQKEGKGHKFYSQSEIEAADDLWDLSEMGWVDPGFIGSQKAGQTGAIFGNKMNPKAMEESLQWIADKIKGVANGTVRSLYDQQLAIARARSAAESAVSGSNTRTIYDEWEATVLGRPLSSVKPGKGTQVVRSVEGLAQSVIDSGWPLARAVGSTQVAQWTSDLAQRLGLSRVKGFKSYQQLAEQLGPHTPYASTMDFVESNLRVSVPPEVKAIANKINSFSASMLLRWFEIPNAAMNMLGIVTNMPSILRSPSTPMMATLAGKNGERIGVVDSYRILAGGFKDMLAGEKHPEWVTMVKNGDTSQSIAELHYQLNLMSSKSRVMKVLTGDKSVSINPRLPRSIQEAKNQLANKGIDGLISLATDTTESMSRAWAHFVGLRLADANGIVGTEARHSFAREVANQAIANYNPLNKPELFQSSIGSMFGLFTSYMQQYNQRLFRWAETGDYLSIGRQLAMQSTLFGVTSVPGYNGLEWLFEGMGDNPDATLTDAIYAKYGPTVGSIVAHGGVQEVTRLFGLSDTGVALYSRGDANFRAPSLDPTRLMAGLNIVAGVAQTATEIGSKTLQAVAGDGSLTGRYLSESLARNMPNRTMKGALTVLLNDGQDVDASGQIIADTQNWMETSLRMLGLRSTRQQGEIEAYYANTSQRRRLAARMDSLREETRSLLRSGKPYDPMEVFNKYVDRGGSPAHFKTWIQDQMKDISTTRGMQQFQDSLKSPTSQLEAWRYETRQ